MQIQQIRSTDGTGTLSYILIDESTKQAAVIDPNKEDSGVIIKTINDRRAMLNYVIDTHTHVDHISGAGVLRKEFNAKIVMHENTKNKWKVADQGDKFGIGDILRANARNEVDLYVNDGDDLILGNSTLRVLFTPGHTDNHISIFSGGNIFTGDLLLIGQAGRSDLPGGSPEEQYDSFTQKVLTLPDSTKIFPGHDYEENEFALLGSEKKVNPFLQQKSKEDFTAFVKEFFPPVADSFGNGKIILQCGTKRVSSAAVSSFTNITPDVLESMIRKDPALTVIDVREPKELAMFGHIPNIKNISSRQIGNRLNELPRDKTAAIAVVCQSGSRSFEVSHFLSKNGYSRVFNLEKGMLDWVLCGKKVDKERSQTGSTV